MKQETKIVAIVLAFLIVFMSGFGLGATKGINIKIEGAAVQAGAQQAAPAPQTTTTAAPAPQTTTAAPAPQTTTAAPAGDTTTTAAPAGDTTTTAAPSNGGVTVPQTKAEIAAAYNKVVNEAKAYTGKVTLKKHDIIDVQLKDLPALAEKIITPVIAKLTTTSPEEYVFDGGKDVNDPNRYVSHKIVPNGRDVNVQEAGLANATATANADGGYTMVLTFIAETSTFDGTSTTSEPTHHKSAMDPLELGSLDLGPITISNADLRYPGATMTATVDGQGRLVKLEQKLPLEGSGTGKAGISVTLEITGSMDGTYEFIYG
ncbi:MAG: hypothetical protein IIX36_02840 [Clostridia bacterium]|nr:hypothetical protein [Clostridia bacterium]